MQIRYDKLELLDKWGISMCPRCGSTKCNPSYIKMLNGQFCAVVQCHNCYQTVHSDKFKESDDLEELALRQVKHRWNHLNEETRKFYDPEPKSLDDMIPDVQRSLLY